MSAKETRFEALPKPAAVGSASGQLPASGSADIGAFLAAAARVQPPKQPGERGRLIFALDATMSRQPTWDMACAIQTEMFTEAAKVGSLDVQLVFFRGLAECRASGWVSEGARLAQLMGRIKVMGGRTQIGRVLSHALQEARDKRVHALVHVGDAMEEPIDDLCARAGELALKSVPVFVFQEGDDPETERAYREIARITRGAYAKFRPGAAAELASLLRAVAAFASGGRLALENQVKAGSAGARLLIGQIT